MSDTVTLPNSARPAPLAKKRPRLHTMYSPQLGIVRRPAESLPVGATYLGRRLVPPHEGISIDFDPNLSAEHARLEVSDGDYQVVLHDLESKNGSWIGSTRLAPGGAAPVRDGQVIRLGSTLFLLRYEPSKSSNVEIASLVGTSLAMRELRARLARLARESAPVLLFGETGTGKELAAGALHQLSQRTGALVAKNCSALPESLIESELFGHTAKAFTGAGARSGAFRSAHLGTLFLDEIGELPLSQQARLLRAVEEGKITPVGADTSLDCDVRLVTATHRDLAAAVADGRFRQDLHARLAHLVVELPPLRERREDVLLLIEHFYSEVARVLNADLVQDLLGCDFRNNVRELRQVADRLRIDGDNEKLRADLRPTRPATVEVAEEVPPTERPYRLPVPSREELIALLIKHLGTVAGLARELDCSPRQVRRWLEQHELDADAYRKKPT